MELKTKDVYRVVCPYGLSEDSLGALMQLYQPLVGGDGILVYLTMLSESRLARTVESHQRLLSIMNLDIMAFEKARVKLEEYRLLNTYVKEGESRNSYLYLLHTPMNASDFFAAGVYARRYVSMVGDRQADVTKGRMDAGSFTSEGYQDITRQVKYVHEDPVDREVNYTTVKPKLTFSEEDDSISFDYSRFLATTTALVFPVELRTQENMYLIGKVATVYGLSADTMRVLTARCVNLEKMEFDGERLKALARRRQPEETASKDPYQLSPISFLQSRQNGAAVSLTESRMLEDLSLKMHFPNEVINVMIEYILRISNNRLNPKFVDMVAGEWARDNVKTKEQALAEIAKKPVNHNRRSSSTISVELPEYYQKKEETEKKERKQASAEKLEEIRRKQDAMKKGGSHGG